MNQPFGHHSVEWRGDPKVCLQLLLRAYGSFSRLARLLSRFDNSFGRIHLLFRLNEFPAMAPAVSDAFFRRSYVLRAAANCACACSRSDSAA